MYIIHNKTKNITSNYEGSWPTELLEKQLNEGDDVVVVSFYSYTIKVPRKEECNGLVEWEWEDFPLP